MKNVLTVTIFVLAMGFGFKTLVTKYSEARVGIKQFACLKANVPMNQCKLK